MATPLTRSNVRGDTVLVDGDFPLRQREFDTIAKLLQSATGIHLTPAKSSLVYSRLCKRIRTLKLPGFESYCEFLSSPDAGAEFSQMCAALTTNVTKFFREPHHFDHLRGQVLPGLIEQARRGNSVRIWSAASSSGEEPFSIALTVLSMMPDAAAHDVRILATDINDEKLEIGRRGTYRAADIEHLPQDLRRKWFRAAAAGEAGAVQVADEARTLVSFRHLNLNGDWPMRRPFDVIFCRNVVIYFDTPVRDKLWHRLASKMVRDGVLYIGHSERVSGPASSCLVPTGVTTYRKRVSDHE